MTAIVIDLKDFSTRTPEQVVRVFLRNHSAETVKAALFDIFRVYATVGKNTPEPDVDIQATADLFDHIIALTKAIHDLSDRPNVSCPVCGRYQSGDST